MFVLYNKKCQSTSCLRILHVEHPFCSYIYKNTIVLSRVICLSPGHFSFFNILNLPNNINIE